MISSPSDDPGKIISDAYLPDSAGLDRSVEARAQVARLLEQRKLSSRFDILRRNIEFASGFPPANEHTGCLGRLDFLESVPLQGTIVRGWLFHREYAIDRLFLSTDTLTTRAYTVGLERMDVKEIFFCFKTALRSGFMVVLPGAPINQSSSLSFHAVLRDGSARDGQLLLVDA